MKKYINNWDELTEEQKIKAEKQFRGSPGLNAAVVHPAAKFFEEHRWVICISSFKITFFI